MKEEEQDEAEEKVEVEDEAMEQVEEKPTAGQAATRPKRGSRKLAEQEAKNSRRAVCQNTRHVSVDCREDR
jgi:hypothetical protein